VDLKIIFVDNKIFNNFFFKKSNSIFTQSIMPDKTNSTVECQEVECKLCKEKYGSEYPNCPFCLVNVKRMKKEEEEHQIFNQKIKDFIKKEKELHNLQTELISLTLKKYPTLISVINYGNYGNSKTMYFTTKEKINEYEKAKNVNLPKGMEDFTSNFTSSQLIEILKNGIDPK